MRTIPRYLDGEPVWSDNEPAAARVQGHGGAAMGFFSGTVLTPSTAVRTAAAQRGLERKPERGPLTRGSSSSAVEPLPAYVRSNEADNLPLHPTTSAEAVLPGGTEDSLAERRRRGRPGRAA